MVLETSYPRVVEIGERAIINARTTVLGHFHGSKGVSIGANAYVGHCVVVLPNVKIGDGAVVVAGSVVTSSVPPRAVVRGNPARVIGFAERPLSLGISMVEFLTSMKPISSARTSSRAPEDS